MDESIYSIMKRWKVGGGGNKVGDLLKVGRGEGTVSAAMAFEFRD